MLLETYFHFLEKQKFNYTISYSHRISQEFWKMRGTKIYHINLGKVVFTPVGVHAKMRGFRGCQISSLSFKTKKMLFFTNLNSSWLHPSSLQNLSCLPSQGLYHGIHLLHIPVNSAVHLLPAPLGLFYTRRSFLQFRSGEASFLC